MLASLFGPHQSRFCVKGFLPVFCLRGKEKKRWFEQSFFSGDYIFSLVFSLTCPFFYSFYCFYSLISNNTFLQLFLHLRAHSLLALFFFFYHLCSIPANLSFAFLRVNPPYHFSTKEKKTLRSVSPHCSQRQVLLFSPPFFMPV